MYKEQNKNSQEWTWRSRDTIKSFSKATELHWHLPRFPRSRMTFQSQTQNTAKQWETLFVEISKDIEYPHLWSSFMFSLSMSPKWNETCSVHQSLVFILHEHLKSLQYSSTFHVDILAHLLAYLQPVFIKAMLLCSHISTISLGDSNVIISDRKVGQN